ncbi:MAG: CapA family protein [Caldilineales bacterium]|nr:CapA family protein [Caldilineales bacterium]
MPTYRVDQQPSPDASGLAAQPQQGAQTPAETPHNTPTPKRPRRSKATPTPTATPTPLPRPVRLATIGALPPDLEAAVAAWVATYPGAQAVADPAQADLLLTTEPTGHPVLERIYVPVARFATVADEIAAADLLGLWLGGPKPGAPPLAVDVDTAAHLVLLWGKPGQVEVLPTVEDVINALWQTPGRRGILPFDRLRPELKALTVDGHNPVDNAFDPAEYPLALRLYLAARPTFGTAERSLRSALAEAVPATNRDPSKLTTLVMTGVTAMARTTALRMEQKGYDYPAKVVGPVLSQADITAISNEIPFVPGCQVNASTNNLTFCSKPEYLEALRQVGVDIVGLTGNHQNDFGAEASRWSLQFYEEQGLPYYGGGRNLEEAWRPLVLEHNGNRLAFLGANAFGPEFAWATASRPGSTPYDYATMVAVMARAREELGADLVFAELQWEESYDVQPLWTQRDAFRQLSDAGADVVTGVQSHVPQAVEFRNGRLILYGLGNFFFDQMWSQETREGLIPRHTIYDGRLLSTQLLTTVLEDFAQPRWATPAERRAILTRVFTASGW